MQDWDAVRGAFKHVLEGLGNFLLGLPAVAASSQHHLNGSSVHGLAPPTSDGLLAMVSLKILSPSSIQI